MKRFCAASWCSARSGAVVAEANRYFAGAGAVEEDKTDPARMATVLYHDAEMLRIVAILMQPFMPAAMGKLLDLLGVRRRRARFSRRSAPAARGRACDAPAPICPVDGAAAADADFPALCRAKRREADLMLIDSHCHLDFPEFAGDRDGVVARAGGRRRAHDHDLDAGREIRRQIAALAEAYDKSFLGRHASRTRRIESAEISTPTHRRARRAIQNASASARPGSIIIMTRRRATSPHRVFRTHIEAAREHGLPLVIHAPRRRCRHGRDPARRNGEGAVQGAAALLHLLAANWPKPALELGLSISFSGVLTFKNSQNLRDIARDVPIDRLLVETDAPFLAPRSHRGKRNEPAFVAETAAVLAEVKGVDAATLAAATTRQCAAAVRQNAAAGGGRMTL